MLSDVQFFVAKISKQILSSRLKPSNGMLLKEIKVITAFSVSCVLEGAFKQFRFINLIVGKKRNGPVPLASIVPHFCTKSICTNNRQLRS